MYSAWNDDVRRPSGNESFFGVSLFLQMRMPAPPLVFPSLADPSVKSFVPLLSLITFLITGLRCSSLSLFLVTLVSMKCTLFTSFHGGGMLRNSSVWSWSNTLFRISLVLFRQSHFLILFSPDFLVKFALRLSSGSLNAFSYAIVDSLFILVKGYFQEVGCLLELF